MLIFTAYDIIPFIMQIKPIKPKVLVIIGPTSSGKSELAVFCAKKLKGQVVSADSRQVYTGLNIGSGKVNLDKQKNENNLFYKGVKHFGLNIANPKRQYSVAQFQKYAKKSIEQILESGSTPIICGGTGHWVDAVVYEQTIPEVKPNLRLRKLLEKKSTEKLFLQLKKLDKARALVIDKFNRRRLIRALEIVITTGKPVPKQEIKERYNTIWIGLNPPKKVLINKIKLRLNSRLKQGMLNEVKKLRKNGLSWKRLESFGLEYKYCALLLQKKISKEEFKSKLLNNIVKYSKRQMTWFKKNPNVNWVSTPSKAIQVLKRKGGKK